MPHRTRPRPHTCRTRVRFTWACDRDRRLPTLDHGFDEAEGHARVLESMQNDCWRLWPA